MYRRAAEAGFPPGMMRLAESIEHREGAEALQLYREAAGKGYSPAMTRLGDITGEESWYIRAVDAGHPAAFAKLAVRKDGAEALGLLRRGAELGDPAAQSALGRELERTDPDAAAKWFKSAAQGGDPVGMERWAATAERRGENGEAAVWYGKAAAAGVPRALHWQAMRLVRTDETAARALLKKAAAAGFAPSMTKLALLDGDQELLLLAAKAGDPEAMMALGGDWVARAADRGYPEALAAVGRIDEAAARGHGPSLAKSGRLEEAARSGDAEGAYRYGMSLPDRAEGTRWIQRAAEAGHATAMRELGLRYRTGNGAPKDESVADTWLRKAAGAGDAEALFLTGSVNEAAEKGYAPAMVALGTREWLERAAAAGHANAWTKLGDIERGAAAGDPEAQVLLADRMSDRRDAYKLYTEAAADGYAPAMMRLGDCHFEGKGTSRSEIDAVNWYRRAANAGSAEALAKLESLGKGL
jgi:TPR repeat protein